MYYADLGGNAEIRIVPDPRCHTQPRSNGHAEHANAEVFKSLKTRSFNKPKKHGKKWIDELPTVLWSICTTATKPTGETPFSLIYRAEVVLPAELKLGSPRALAYSEAGQGHIHAENLLLLEEARNRAAVRAARYQQGLRRYHANNIRSRTLEAGDLVLRRILS